MLSLQTVLPDTLELLKVLMQQPLFKDMRLVGGTSLALQYGHRRSVDLDFFGTTTEDVTNYASAQITVNVPTPASVDKNVQTVQSTSRRNNTALGSVTSLTCSTAGTYDVYWTCARSNTSQTWGSQLYINGTAYGTENTTFSNNVQNNHLTGVQIPANATVAVYGRSRSGYYIYVPQLTIMQTA